MFVRLSPEMLLVIRSDGTEEWKKTSLRYLGELGASNLMAVDLAAAQATVANLRRVTARLTGSGGPSMRISGVQLVRFSATCGGITRQARHARGCSD